MKIGIITLYNQNNFGNRLQNLAVQSLLEQYGVDCETLVFVPDCYKKQKLKKSIKYILGLYNKEEQMKENRERTFKKFSRKYIRTHYINEGYSKVKLASQYDFFVVGSDQVWNPCFGDFDRLYETMFLRFCPVEKRICLSPSFGVQSIPDEWVERFQIGLRGFSQLSVREQSGQQLIKELSGKDSICTIDPTMLFDSTVWSKYANKVEEKDYVLAYFLGVAPLDLLPNDIAIIDIMDKPSKNYEKYGPSDFIGLISNAKAVYTDSFHACVFAILFGKPFCVLERKDGNKKMSSRIQTLLLTFGVNYDPDKPNLIQIDTEARDRILLEKRLDVRNYLEQQINF